MSDRFEDVMHRLRLEYDLASDVLAVAEDVLNFLKYREDPDKMEPAPLLSAPLSPASRLRVTLRKIIIHFMF